MTALRTSPFELSVLIHYYAHVDDHEAMTRNPPVWPETIDRLSREGMIAAVPRDELRDACYRLTVRGHVFVEALCSVPFPEQRWEVPWPSTR